MIGLDILSFGITVKIQIALAITYTEAEVYNLKSHGAMTSLSLPTGLKSTLACPQAIKINWNALTMMVTTSLAICAGPLVKKITTTELAIP